VFSEQKNTVHILQWTERAWSSGRLFYLFMCMPVYCISINRGLHTVASFRFIL